MLKYLFTAEFTDGSKLEQTQDDRSLLIEGKNTYYDLLHSDKQLKTFTINEQKIWNPTKVTVNLLNGIITVNGVDLYHESLPSQSPKYELYWMMNVIQTMKMENDVTTGKVVKMTPQTEQRTFFLGWKTEINGKEYEHIVGVK